VEDRLFLYPWAVAFNSSAAGLHPKALIFISILGGGTWLMPGAKRALEWS